MDNMKISAILYSIVAIIFILCAATGRSPAFYGGAAAFIALATAVVANFATTELSFANSSCRAFLICLPIVLLDTLYRWPISSDDWQNVSFIFPLGNPI